MHGSAPLMMPMRPKSFYRTTAQRWQLRDALVKAAIEYEKAAAIEETPRSHASNDRDLGTKAYDTACATLGHNIVAQLVPTVTAPAPNRLKLLSFIACDLCHQFFRTSARAGTAPPAWRNPP